MNKASSILSRGGSFKVMGANSSITSRGVIDEPSQLPTGSNVVVVARSIVGPILRTPREPEISNKHDIVPEPPKTLNTFSCPVCHQQLIFQRDFSQADTCPRCQVPRSSMDRALCESCTLEFCRSCID